ncbi:hypothetical protein AJ85_17120 [Alkalihalobacillus alcalophilus ATCC 27647 = CGMCC 1.3604]|uniref:Sporulation protein n=1 Tax=Alkalihalobacillus alcalophilus ATCC 27647 = CGMCC 1.3604 TaxID=1218173 RepID=A0A094YSQ4_ALKAL|nr:YhcN/YlaJ family sporulation lipoprotein [Alkalihalobacillus alcalophilus]KGA96517.1 hypothetical protein BALCAV_0215830 [Alkalihalobacillus alcalophilus ATCC 27647 = CGMCC 1.3604]MED1561265.1 YhcN/YlaJ family sporulation lipoprotein [Alkalihalobacillus alcalophilus]THG89511.1 hypothetical protein AJ85_17120 [Alkalihalobacillus alcalophilus ATCC 27647 = CGMCC 1.3604]
MKKIALTVASTLMLASSLVACNQADQAGTMRNHSVTGVEMSGTRHQVNNYGAEGPVTDMFTNNRHNRTERSYNFQNNGYYGASEFGSSKAPTNRVGTYGPRSFGASPFGMENNQIGHHDRRSGFWNQGITGNDRARMVDENGVLKRRLTDRNFGVQSRSRHHGGVNVQNFRGNQSIGRSHTMNRTGFQAANYHSNYDGQTASKIAKHVEAIDGVDDAHVIVHENKIVVAVDVDSHADGLESKIKRTVQGLSNDKDVHVVSDKEMYGRVETMDNQLRSGAAFEEIGATFEDMIRDLGRAVQRPFERSR